jgi:hypothetical protein
LNNTHNKRRISRADYRLSCTLHTGEAVTPCVIQNISLTGLFIEADEAEGISVGEKTNLVIEHFCPECTTSEIQCEIVRKDGRFLGLKVLAIDYDTFIRLKDLLVHLVPDKGKIDGEILKMIVDNKGE